MAGVAHYPCVWRRKNGRNQSATQKVIAAGGKKGKTQAFHI